MSVVLVVVVMVVGIEGFIVVHMTTEPFLFVEFKNREPFFVNV